MCSVASFDYTRGEFRRQASDTPAVSYCIACMHRRHTATKLIISFHLQLRQARCVFLSSVHDRLRLIPFLYAHTKILCVLLHAAGQILEKGGGQAESALEGALLVLDSFSSEDVNALRERKSGPRIEVKRGKWLVTLDSMHQTGARCRRFGSGRARSAPPPPRDPQPTCRRELTRAARRRGIIEVGKRWKTRRA